MSNPKREQLHKQHALREIEKSAIYLAVKEEHYQLIKKLVNELPEESFIDIVYRNDFRL